MSDKGCTSKEVFYGVGIGTSPTTSEKDRSLMYVDEEGKRIHELYSSTRWLLSKNIEDEEKIVCIQYDSCGKEIRRTRLNVDEQKEFSVHNPGYKELIVIKEGALLDDAVLFALKQYLDEAGYVLVPKEQWNKK